MASPQRPATFMIHDPDIGSRLGHKRDHHRSLRSWCDDLDSEASAIQPNGPVRRISVAVCVCHAANMACATPI